MPSGWTGGQYSLFRALLGGWLLADSLLGLAAPRPLAALAAAVGAACGAALIAGWRDRTAAILALLAQAAALAASWLPLEASRVLALWLLLAHALEPPAPYGSLAAAGRPDPAGTFRMNGTLYGATWVLVAAWYAFSGWSMLVDPGWLAGGFAPGPAGAPPGGIPPWIARAIFAAHVLFAPAALFRRVRPWLWLGFTALHALALVGLGHVGSSARMLLVHALLFDPAWVRGRGGDSVETLFYDGACGLCHRLVRFVLAEDRAARFRFAPLCGATFDRRIPPSRREGLPDSLVVERADGALLTRSEAVLHVAGRLGGVWRILGALAWIVPRGLRDAAYDRVGAMRRRLFAAPHGPCPIVSPELRGRFHD